ncbi:MAG: hypothetical protein ACE5D0_02530 [Fidelibacterota bacterium]
MIDQLKEILFTQETLFLSLKWFFIIGSCFGIIVGASLIFIPDSFRGWNNKLNHWYSSRKSLKPFEIMRETDSHVYKHNKIWGWVMLACSGIFLYYFISWQFPQGALKHLFSSETVAILAEMFFRTIWLFLAIFIIAGIPVWILLIINTDLLKKISHIFNHWFSTRMALLPMVQMNYRIDTWVMKNGRIFGIIFIIGSAFILLKYLYLS